MNTAIICLIGVLPSIFLWLHERLLRRLSESRLVIAQSVTQMEKLLLQQAVTMGDASHDVLFASMRSVQNNDSFSMNWSVLRRTPKHVEDARKALRRELDHEGCPFRGVLHAFSCHYFRAFRFKHPIKCVAYVLWLFTIASGLGGMLLLLNVLLALRRGLGGIKNAAKNVRDLAADTFMALSFNANGNKTA